MKHVKEKTSLQLSKPLVLQAKEMGRLIGVGKGDMVSMGLALLLIQLAPLKHTARKRQQLLDQVEKTFQKILVDAREKAAYRG